MGVVVPMVAFRIPLTMTMPTVPDIAVANDRPVARDNGRGRGDKRGLWRRRVRRASHDEDAQTEKTQER